MIFHRETEFSFYNVKVTAKDFIVDEILGKEAHRTVGQFTDYDSVELTFDELKEVIEGHYPDYYKEISSVKGVYIIIDGNTRKMYVRSAYANRYHGGKCELLKLF